MLVGVCIVAGGFIYVLLGNNADNKETISRMERNYRELERERKALVLTYDELNDRQAAKIKQLSDSLEIKPKHLIRYVGIQTVDSIRDTIPVEIIKIDTNVYSFKKDTACFQVAGLISTKTSPPSIELTNLTYRNEIDYIVYKQRRKWDFWFIHTRWFGKMETKIDIQSNCGESRVEDIEIIKK